MHVPRTSLIQTPRVILPSNLVKTKKNVPSCNVQIRGPRLHAWLMTVTSFVDLAVVRAWLQQASTPLKEVAVRPCAAFGLRSCCNSTRRHCKEKVDRRHPAHAHVALQARVPSWGEVSIHSHTLHQYTAAWVSLSSPPPKTLWHHFIVHRVPSQLIKQAKLDAAC